MWFVSLPVRIIFTFWTSSKPLHLKSSDLPEIFQWKFWRNFLLFGCWDSLDLFFRTITCQVIKIAGNVLLGKCCYWGAIRITVREKWNQDWTIDKDNKNKIQKHNTENLTKMSNMYPQHVPPTCTLNMHPQHVPQHVPSTKNTKVNPSARGGWAGIVSYKTPGPIMLIV